MVVALSPKSQLKQFLQEKKDKLMSETYKGQKMLEKAKEIQEFWAYDLTHSSNSDLDLIIL